MAGGQAPDDRPRRQRDRRGDLHGRRRRHPSLRGQRKLAAYLGLDPKVRQSGTAPANHGHISRQGSASARHALVEACWSTVRQPGPIAAFYTRVRAKRGHSIAVVASARKLASLVSADARRGLRLRAAVADEEEDAPPRARRRRCAPAGRPRHLVHQRRDAPRRTRARAPGAARLRTNRYGPSLRFDSSSLAPARTLARQAAVDQPDLTFIRRPRRQPLAPARRPSEPEPPRIPAIRGYCRDLGH
jgi:Transposase IS116/IS110/IS902 family